VQDDDWSDDSDSEAQAQDPAKKVKTLEKKLAQLQRDFADYKAFVSSKLDIARLAESLKISDDGPDASQSTPRDDDTHYFQSYGEHGP
jgi:protein arginine N-methyltransferase 3